MKTKHILYVTILSLFIASNAFSSGYYIMEQTGRGGGNAFSGNTVGYGDGSEVYFNPAAMSQIDSTTISSSTSIIEINARFHNRNTTNAFGVPVEGHGANGGGIAPVPSAYIVAPITEDLHAGFGFMAPYGMKVKYNDTWLGRYKADNTDLQILTFAPALSYKLTNNFSLGTHIGINFADAEVSNAIDFGTIGLGLLGAQKGTALGLAPQQNDGYAKLSGNDWAVNYSLGALYTYGEDNRNRFGVSYRSKTAFDLEGNADFTVPEQVSFIQDNNVFVDTSISSHLTMPEHITAGNRYWVTDKLALQAEANWIRWSKFKELRFKYGSAQSDSVEAEDWNNTFRYSAGALYKLTDDLTWNVGYMYDESPVPSNRRSPRIPDNDRHLLGTGFTYDITDNLSFNASYVYIIMNDSSIKIKDGVGNTLDGKYDLGIQVSTLGLTYSF